MPKSTPKFMHRVKLNLGMCLGLNLGIDLGIEGFRYDLGMSFGSDLGIDIGEKSDSTLICAQAWNQAWNQVLHRRGIMCEIRCGIKSCIWVLGSFQFF